LIPGLETAISDCSGALSSLVTLTKEVRVLQSGDCISDVLALVPVVQKIVSDVEAENISSVISDVESAIPQVESAISACSSESLPAIKNLIAMIRTSNFTQPDAATCWNDSASTVVDIYNTVEAFLAKNTTDGIIDVFQAVSDATGAVASCWGVNPLDLLEYVYANVLNT